MNAPGPFEMLESCPVAGEALWLRHATAFVTAFVTPAKRHRWHYLVTQRPSRIRRSSSKLHSDLDRRTCRSVGVVPAGTRGDGVFYAFDLDPRIVSVDTAAVLASGDAIFSLVPGELALYFFHESEVWLCQAGRP